MCPNALQLALSYENNLGEVLPVPERVRGYVGYPAVDYNFAHALHHFLDDSDLSRHAVDLFHWSGFQKRAAIKVIQIVPMLYLGISGHIFVVP